LNKILTCSILVAIVLLSAGLPVHARGLESTVAGSRIIESKPKNVITASLEVTNTTDSHMECMPRITLPPGWKIITPVAPFWIERRQTSVILVSFYIPGDAPPEDYEVDCYLASTRDPTISTHQSLLIKVLPTVGLKIRLTEAPRRVISGQEYTATFLLTNESNQEEHISLDCSSSDGFPVTPDIREAVLGPGASRTLTVRIQTRDIEQAAKTHKVVCRAFSTRNEEIQAQAQCLVEIIPVRAREDNYHTIPANIVVRGTLDGNGKTESSFQGEIQGEGTLDEEGRRSMAFLFRGPDTLNKSLYGLRENYTLRTWSTDYDLTVGDSQFSLSELTEQYLTARGADGSLSYKGMFLRGYRAKTVWDDPAVTQTAASAGFASGSGIRFAVNGISKEREDFEEPDKVITAAAELKPIAPLSLQLEGGVGTHLDERDNGYLAKLSYLGSALSSRARYMYCAPNFPGYYQDRELISFDISGRLTDSLHVNGAFNRETTNPDRDVLRQPSGLDTLCQTGFNYRWDPETTYTLTWEYRTNEDRMLDPAFDYSTQTLRAGVLRNYSNLSLNLSGEAGRRNDRLTSLEEFIYEVSSSMYLHLGNSQTYGGYFRLSQGQNAEVGTDRNLTAGLTCSLPLMKDTPFNCAAQIDTYSDSNVSNKYMLTSSIGHSFTDRSVLSLQASHSFYDSQGTDSQDETSILLEYSYPFNIPVGKKQGAGSISGVIRDALSGKPLENVIVRVEDTTTATGPDGKFTLTSIKPGTSYLSIDASRIGLDLIPTCANPLPMTLDGGQEKALDIGIVRKAVLTGKIVLYGFDGDRNSLGYGLDAPEAAGAPEQTTPEMKEISGLAHVLVELVSKTETLRVLTDSQGRFRFNEVRPDTWTLVVNPETLPAHHAFDKNNITMKLEPGQTQDLFIKVLPRKRSIMIIEQGETIIQEKVKKK